MQRLVFKGIVALVLWSAMNLQAAQIPEPATDAEAVAESAGYIIGPGDVLEIFVWNNPELSAKVPVRPDGKISMPLAQDMLAVGKTPIELAVSLESALAEYVRSPKVNVMVTQWASVFSQIKVIGQVKSPQSLPFREGMTVLDAVLAVGGLSEFAAGNRARIVRKEGEREREIVVRLEDLMNKGRMNQNQALLPGDVIVVPASRF
jgi:polysaccharide export outer membrane protein